MAGIFAFIVAVILPRLQQQLPLATPRLLCLFVPTALQPRPRRVRRHDGTVWSKKKRLHNFCHAVFRARPFEEDSELSFQA